MKNNICGVFAKYLRRSSAWSGSFLGFLSVPLFLLFAGDASAGDALEQTIALDIAPNTPLDEALVQWGAQTGIQVMMNSDEVAKAKTNGLRGKQRASQALATILHDSGLSYTVEGSTVYVIAGHYSDEVGSKPASDNRPQKKMEGDGNVQADVRQRKIEEVVVTAQKREERLQDVPVPVTLIQSTALLDNNQLKLQDYYTNVPGLNVVPEASGSFQSLSIRGITTGIYANPTVGVTVDDVPYGTSTSNGGGGSGQLVPDIDPADLARVEVLRGPQGTLYGASSMGGLFKFVTVDPSTERISGRVQADLSGVFHGSGPGYGVRGSVNVPLTDTFAMRANVFARRDAGYVDNVQTGERGVNSATADGGRLSAIWKPSDALSIKLSALYQDIRGDGEPDVDRPVNGYEGPTLGDLQQSHLVGTGSYDRSVQAYSAILTAKLGAAELTSVSGYNVQAFADSYDLSYLYGPYVEPIFQVTGAFAPEKNRTKKYTQELRLSVPIAQSIDWLIGGFYTHEKSEYVQSALASDPSTGRIAGNAITLSFPPTFTELAAFTDLTVHLNDRLDVQIGGRESHIRQTFSELETGPFVPLFFGVDSPLILPKLESTSNAFTYLVTPRFKISPTLMVYARLASGFRAGGANYSAGEGTPGAYSPDKTQNYELGLKGDFLDHTLSLDASVYRIDWKDIQVSEINPDTGIYYTTNASRAKSQGIELSLGTRPVTGLKIEGWIAWDDAVLTEAFPANSASYGAAGDRLPYSSRFSGSLTMEQEFSISSSVTGFVGGALSYVGNRQGEFTASPDRTNLPAYVKTDLRTGLQYDSWSASIFVNNVTDRRGVLYGGLGAVPPFGFVYIQPRTVGMSVYKTF